MSSPVLSSSPVLRSRLLLWCPCELWCDECFGRRLDDPEPAALACEPLDDLDDDRVKSSAIAPFTMSCAGAVVDLAYARRHSLHNG